MCELVVRHGIRHDSKIPQGHSRTTGLLRLITSRESIKVKLPRFGGATSGSELDLGLQPLRHAPGLSPQRTAGGAVDLPLGAEGYLEVHGQVATGRAAGNPNELILPMTLLIPIRGLLGQGRVGFSSRCMKFF